MKKIQRSACIGRNHAMGKLWLIVVLAASCLVLLIASPRARDLGQWENTDPELRAWFQVLRQPDNPNISCCGESDAYWCDDIFVEKEQTFCRITDSREDVPLKRPHIDVGTVVGPIPANKFGPAKWGNPTGHAVVFLSYQRNVYCFIQTGGV
jgi:hypothetical protein